MGANASTLREVARIAGVSPSTVSRFLTPDRRHLVNADTATRVEEAIRVAGYSPNSLARGLKTRRSLTVGVVIPDLRNPVFPSMVRGIEDRLERDGYTALIVSTDNDAARERRSFERLRARQVDGVICATATREHEVVSRAIAEDVPLALLNRTIAEGGVNAVVPDDRLGVRLAVDHLVELGHTAIAHVGGPAQTTSGQRRRAGFRAAMRRRGLQVPKALITEAEAFTEAAGHRAARELLDSGESLTAIVAANDLVALGCCDALRERGLRCPNHVSVTGFNDMPFSDRFNPPLTTLRLPHHELGVLAAELVLASVAADASTVEPREVLVKPTLVVRRSTAPPG
ncbi:MAG: LacI family DNA-binding transcriptional regulator [Solirubrobacterales bacterium]|nr:LacI family DNA-binding transcriptional regulator [Solirubrobacterales bacterium]